MILKDLKQFVEESNHHIAKDDLLQHIKEADEKENQIVEFLKFEAFRSRITSLIEVKTNLKWPESMHLCKDIEDAIMDGVNMHNE